ncbi:hypothetical protein LBMAG33_5180 [Candidatus Levyibacteriota bacterium]|nr:hypothetical protein LBMAG33_5180 [Candidatus Levybacteria bacterium]
MRITIFFFFLFASFFSSFQNLKQLNYFAYAQEQNINSTSSGIEKQEYNLPYSGLLPDNLFYPIKMLRDRIVYFFIKDSLKRTEFALLQADKRIGGGYLFFLKDKKNNSNALPTLSGGQNYFEEATINLKESSRQGMDIDYVFRNMQNSLGKQEEIFIDIMSKIDKDNIKIIMDIEARRKKLKNQLKIFIEKQGQNNE